MQVDILAKIVNEHMLKDDKDKDELLKFVNSVSEILVEDINNE